MSDVTSRDYPLDAEFTVSTADQLKALGSPLRGTIVDLVLERAMSVTELADRVGRPRGTVAHHVDVLVDAGLIRVVRTRRVRAVDERLYGRVALTYVLSHRPGEVPFLDQFVSEVDLERLGRTDLDGVGGVTYRRARIPAARAAEFDTRLRELAIEFATEPRGGEVEYGLYLALFPTNRRIGPRDASDDHGARP